MILLGNCRLPNDADHRRGVKGVRLHCSDQKCTVAKILLACFKEDMVIGLALAC